MNFSLSQLNNDLLNFLIDWKEINPNLSFWLRRRNTNNRLNEGQWFQGGDRYVSIGFSKRPSGNLSTKSIAFGVWLEDDGSTFCFIEMLFKSEKNPRVLECYNRLIKEVGFTTKDNEIYRIRLGSGDPIEKLDEFLSNQLVKIENIIKDMGLEEEVLISDEDFKKSLKKVLKIREKLQNQNQTKIILANITWNSKDWKEPSDDKSGHAWVGGENVAQESWNFDFDNKRNDEEHIYGFVKFTAAPNAEGDNNLIIFYSQGKIVGFYGQTEILKDWVEINENQSYNLIGKKELSLVLPNKIDEIKEKGFLEDKQKVGQVGFTYLKKIETALDILDEAIKLNPDQSEKLNNIKSWLEEGSAKQPDEERLIERFRSLGYDETVAFFDVSNQFLDALDISIGDKRICYNLPVERNIGITVGQRYCIYIYIKKKGNQYAYIDTSATEEDWAKTAENLAVISKVLPIIIESAGKELARTDKTGYTDKSSLSLERAIFDNNYRQELLNKAFPDKDIDPETMEENLNQILFGPPGTGKTYHTINKAVKIADPQFYKENKSDRDKLKDRFKLLLINQKNDENGQIGFTTFHQSFCYEDFVEGIKPIEPKDEDTFLKYKVQEGIFKKICRLAADSLKAKEIKSNQLVELSNDEFERAHFYKMSLGDSQREEDQEIFEYCSANNCITIGFGDGLDYSGKDEREVKTFAEENGVNGFAVQAINYFKNYLKVGDYVVISYGNHYVRAIGRVTGEYEYREVSPFVDNTWYKHFRSVEWIFNDKEVSAKEIYHKNLSQQTIYKLIKSELKKEFFVKNQPKDPLNLPKNPKNYVLVIDEINRGNVSSIFGELITLIEKDKRAGGDEELSVILPYSKKEFKVPSNVFIIGTMNTADRSIEALDTALRRRFSFEEMPPNSYLIKTEGKLKDRDGVVDGIAVDKLLDRMNDRIEKLIDKDHKIGHSYFLKVDSQPKLIKVFEDEVIPLLEEYFFGDFGKIGLVLGESFIAKKKDDEVKFAEFKDYDPSIANDLLEKPVYVISKPDKWDFKAIYE